MKESAETVDWNVLMAQVDMARNAVGKHFDKTGKRIGSVDCPVCSKGKLHYRISGKGHIHGRCNGKDCVNWSE